MPLPHDTLRLRSLARVALWLAAVVLMTGALLWKCHATPTGDARPLTAARCDSLLCHRVPHTSVLRYEGFTAYFDPAIHMSRCVTYLLTPGHLEGDAQRTDLFMADSAVAGCPQPDAYAGTALHRGHLAPAADMRWSQRALQQTFLMTNICPQHASLNEGGWANLEQKCREWAERDRALVVACGPVLERGLDTIPHSGGIPLPRRYFKVVMAPQASPGRAIAFVYPNSEAAGGALRRYATTVDSVERLTGIDFFTLLPPGEQQQFESYANLQRWLH